MQLNEIIKRECCNYMAGNRCIKNNMNKCHVKETKDLGGKACSYFKRCVLPLAIREGHKHVISSYETIDPSLAEDAKIKIRYCSCGNGNTMSKGKKMCDICRKNNRGLKKSSLASFF